MLRMVQERRLDADRADAVLQDALRIYNKALTRGQEIHTKIEPEFIQHRMMKLQQFMLQQQLIYDSLHAQCELILAPFYDTYNQQLEMHAQFVLMRDALAQVRATDAREQQQRESSNDPSSSQQQTEVETVPVALRWNDKLSILNTFLNTLQAYFSALPGSFLAHLQQVFDSFEQWLYGTNQISSALISLLTRVNFWLDSEEHGLALLYSASGQLFFFQRFVPMSLQLAQFQSPSAYLLALMSDFLSMTCELVPFLEELHLLFQQLDECAAQSQARSERLAMAAAATAETDKDASPPPVPVDDSTQAHVLIQALIPFKMQLFTYLTELRPFLLQLLDSSYHFDAACRQTEIGYKKGVEPRLKKLIPFLQHCPASEQETMDAEAEMSARAATATAATASQ